MVRGGGKGLLTANQNVTVKSDDLWMMSEGGKMKSVETIKRKEKRK